MKTWIASARPPLSRGMAALVALALLTACTGGGSDESGATPSELGFDGGSSDDRVQIEWYVGLGTGSRTEQIPAQQEIVDAFNAEQDEIELVLEIVENDVAFEVLEERVASGDAPDIVGPVGLRGGNAFRGQFLALDDLVEDSSFDLGDYDAEQVEVWRDDDGSLTGIPFGVFPSFLFYNQEIFDAAGVAHPPHEFGELYEGEEWDMDALYELALQLTLDADGRNATDPGFDPDQIVQWGFHHQYLGDPRSHGSFFGAGTMVADDGTAQIPEPWLAEWEWYHRLIWEGRGAPNANHIDSDLLAHGNSFNSGNVAIAFSHLWYTGNLRNEDGSAQTFFDLAVVPSYEGDVTSKIHADTFRIFESTEHPAEAFAVLEYLLGPAEPELLQLYGSFPARLDLRADFLAELSSTFTQDVDWSVAEASLAHPDLPSHEGYLPNHLDAEARLAEFGDELTADPGLDVQEAANTLEADLTDIFSAEQSDTPDASG